jgi:hypothetical protein
MDGLAHAAQRAAGSSAARQAASLAE